MEKLSFTEIMEVAHRMHERYCRNSLCSGCPLCMSNISQCRKFAFEHPDEFDKIVMEWGEMHKSGVNEFSADQEKQIDAVIYAAENLVRVMTTRPEYLKGTVLKGWNDKKDGQWPIPPSQIADAVADILSRMNINIFFPVHIEGRELYVNNVKIFDIEYVRDTYNEPICNEQVCN